MKRVALSLGAFCACLAWLLAALAWIDHDKGWANSLSKPVELSIAKGGRK